MSLSGHLYKGGDIKTSLGSLLRVVGCYEVAENVAKALSRALKSVNSELEGKSGRISKMDAEVHARIGGGGVKILVAVSDDYDSVKEVIGVNVRDFGETKSMERALYELNKKLEGIKGEIVDVFSTTRLSLALPGWVYTTLIVAVNKLEEETTQ